MPKQEQSGKYSSLTNPLGDFIEQDRPYLEVRTIGTSLQRFAELDHRLTENSSAIPKQEQLGKEYVNEYMDFNNLHCSQALCL